MKIKKTFFSKLENMAIDNLTWYKVHFSAKNSLLAPFLFLLFAGGL